MGRPKLRKSNLNLKQFYGSVIKTLGSFEGIFVTKTCYKIIPINAQKTWTPRNRYVKSGYCQIDKLYKVWRT